jgi:hypothetical protein
MAQQLLQILTIWIIIYICVSTCQTDKSERIDLIPSSFWYKETLDRDIFKNKCNDEKTKKTYDLYLASI